MGYAIEDDVRVNQDGAQPRHKLISRAAHQRMPFKPVTGAIDVAKQSVRNVIRSDAGEITPDFQQIASCAQTTRLRAAMLATGLPDRVFHIEFLAEASIQLAKTDIDIGAQL